MLRRPLESAFAASVAMMHEPAAMDRPPIVQCLFQRIEHEAGNAPCAKHYSATKHERSGLDRLQSSQEDASSQ